MPQCREFLAIQELLRIDVGCSVVALIDASEACSALADDIAENCLGDRVAADRSSGDLSAAREPGVAGLCPPGMQPSFHDADPSGSFQKTVALGTFRVHSPFSTFTEDWQAARLAAPPSRGVPRGRIRDCADGRDNADVAKQRQEVTNGGEGAVLLNY